MLQRTKLFNVGERAMKLGINISEIIVLYMETATFLNSVYLLNSLSEKVDAIQECEIRTKKIIGKIVSKMNLESNEKIKSFDEAENLHNQMSIYISILSKNIEKKRTDILEKISPYKDTDQEVLSNKMLFNEYFSYIEEIMNVMIIGTLEEATKYYSKIEGPDEDYFWYAVFFFFVDAIKSVAPIDIEGFKKIFGTEELKRAVFSRTGGQGEVDGGGENLW